MKPIETYYNGYRFRSRLEARWAVFFDKLGVPYEYEKEGFDLDGELYLPDFWLPLPDPVHKGAGYWVEIKPMALSEREERLLEKLVRQTGHNAFAYAGNIGFREFQVTKWSLNRRTGGVLKDKSEEPDDYLWPIVVLSHLNQWDTKANVLEAMKAARSARFEHGEKG